VLSGFIKVQKQFKVIFKMDLEKALENELEKKKRKAKKGELTSAPSAWWPSKPRQPFSPIPLFLLLPHDAWLPETLTGSALIRFLWDFLPISSSRAL
jgi:hypothetical protein